MRVINPRTGKSTLANAQHDTASQATLLSKRLIEELELGINTDYNLTIRTLTDQTIADLLARVWTRDPTT